MMYYHPIHTCKTILKTNTSRQMTMLRVLFIACLIGAITADVLLCKDVGEAECRRIADKNGVQLAYYASPPNPSRLGCCCFDEGCMKVVVEGFGEPNFYRPY
ncbi:hypothetical protein BKA57DRAFT_316490 [Linnemannia elongata]|nr:hypothetical protein BKA57DRAFT_316490 [Linnemannia elongata]